MWLMYSNVLIANKDRAVTAVEPLFDRLVKIVGERG